MDRKNLPAVLALLFCFIAGCDDCVLTCEEPYVERDCDCNGIKICDCVPRDEAEPCDDICSGSKSFAINQKSPLLSQSTLDGPIDFGVSYLKVDIPETGDSIRTNIKGRMAVVGGNCPNEQCKMRIVLLEVGSVADSVTTKKGVEVSGLKACNVGVWSGDKRANNRLAFGGDSKLMILAKVDGKYRGFRLSASSYLDGTIFYESTRLKGGGQGAAKNNRMEINGQFNAGNARAELHISFWLTCCQPTVDPKAYYVPDIEAGVPGRLHLESNAKLLENMKNSRDLCDAMLVEDPTTVCTAGGTSEFPTFRCGQELGLPQRMVAERVSSLEFHWTDAFGRLLSNEADVELNHIPAFPVSLVVRNKWGKEITGRIASAPPCSTSMPLSGGACNWYAVGASRSHQPVDSWCPEGTFITQLDLDGGSPLAPEDSPIVGRVRCCAPEGAEAVEWNACAWHSVGAAKSHQRGGAWCPNGTYLTRFDLDGEQTLDAHDAPIVGRAYCCAPANPEQVHWDECEWREVGPIKSHQAGGPWCPDGKFLTQFDLDGDRAYSDLDTPFVGGACCCGIEEP